MLIGMVVLLVIPSAFPDWQSASFFSTALLQPDKALDLVALYIPANPFSSLATNVVPAVVLFCILPGVGMSGVFIHDFIGVIITRATRQWRPQPRSLLRPEHVPCG